MKTKLILFIVATALMYSCSSKHEQEGDLININVRKSYPEKEIKLTDIADVTYVKLDEADEEYIFQGEPITITPNRIVIHESRKGDFLFFSREGKPISKFNKRGNGPGEYSRISGGAVYDENRDELFVASRNIIFVYSSDGTYKRTISLPSSTVISALIDQGDNSLFFFNGNKIQRRLPRQTSSSQAIRPNNVDSDSIVYGSSFVRISKTDGELIECVYVPEDFSVDLSLTVTGGRRDRKIPVQTSRIVGYGDGFILHNQETDTLYFYNADKQLTPFMFRSPSVKEMNPPVFINGVVKAGDFQFFEQVTLKSKENSAPESRSYSSSSLPTTYLMRDMKDGAIYKQKIVLPDFKGKEIMLGPSVLKNNRYSEFGFLEFKMEELFEAYSENRLSGKLKEIVDSIGDEDENSIYLLLKFK